MCPGIAVLPAPLLPLLAHVGMRVCTRAMACSDGWGVVKVRIVAQEFMKERIRLLIHAVVSARGMAGPDVWAARSGGCFSWGPLETDPHGGHVARASEGGALLG